MAGVHDIKTLKMKISNEEIQKYNSPWNIVADFKVDMSSVIETSTNVGSYNSKSKYIYENGDLNNKYVYVRGESR